MRIIEIIRQSKRIMIEDTIKQLRKKDMCSDFKMLALPWYYNTIIVYLNTVAMPSIFTFFLVQTGLFLGPGLCSETVLGSTHMYQHVPYLLDSQNLSFKTF